MYAAGLKNIWAVVGRVVSVAGGTTKHPFFRKIYLPEVRGRSLSAGEDRLFICSDSRCLKCRTWTWKNCHFSLAVLGPFMAESLASGRCLPEGRLQKESKEANPRVATEKNLRSL